MRNIKNLINFDPLPVNVYKEIYFEIENHLINSTGKKLDEDFLRELNNIFLLSGYYTEDWEQEDKNFIFGLSLFFEKEVMTIVINGLSFPYKISYGKDKEIWWAKATGKMVIALENV